MADEGLRSFYQYIVKQVDGAGTIYKSLNDDNTFLSIPLYSSILKDGIKLNIMHSLAHYQNYSDKFDSFGYSARLNYENEIISISNTSIQILRSDFSIDNYTKEENEADWYNDDTKNIIKKIIIENVDDNLKKIVNKNNDDESITYYVIITPDGDQIFYQDQHFFGPNAIIKPTGKIILFKYIGEKIEEIDYDEGKETVVISDRRSNNFIYVIQIKRLVNSTYELIEEIHFEYDYSYCTLQNIEYLIKKSEESSLVSVLSCTYQIHQFDEISIKNNISNQQLYIGKEVDESNEQFICIKEGYNQSFSGGLITKIYKTLQSPLTRVISLNKETLYFFNNPDYSYYSIYDKKYLSGVKFNNLKKLEAESNTFFIDSSNNNENLIEDGYCKGSVVPWSKSTNINISYVNNEQIYNNITGSKQLKIITTNDEEFYIKQVINTIIHPNEVLAFRCLYAIGEQKQLDYLKVKLEFFDQSGYLINTVINEIEQENESAFLYKRFAFFGYSINRTAKQIVISIIGSAPENKTSEIYLDAICLTKENAGTFYTYDGFQNIIEKVSNDITTTIFYNPNDSEAKNEPKLVVANGASVSIDYNEDINKHAISKKTGLFGVVEKYSYDENSNLIESLLKSSIGNMLEKSTYGNFNELLSFTNKRNKKTEYNYAGYFYNLISIIHPSDSDDGVLTNSDDKYTYDNQNRLTNVYIKKKSNTNEILLNQIQYDEKSRVDIVKEDSGTFYQFTYNNENLLKRVSIINNNTDTYLLLLTYQNETSPTAFHSGLISQKKYGSNGDAYSYTYNSNYDLVRIDLLKRSGGSESMFEYTYDNKKRLTIIDDLQEESAVSQFFTYNIKDQITTINNEGNTFDYIYSKYGEIIHRKINTNSKLIHQSYTYPYSFTNHNPENFYYYVKRYFEKTNDDSNLVYSCFLNEKTNDVISKDLTYINSNGAVADDKIECVECGLNVQYFDLTPCLVNNGKNKSPLYTFEKNADTIFNGTLMFWFKIYPSFVGNLLYLGNRNSNFDYVIASITSNANDELIIKLQIRNEFGIYNYETNLKVTNDWNFIALTWTSSDDSKLSYLTVYLNDSKEYFNLTNKAFIIDNCFDLRIGSDYANPTDVMKGYITGIILSNRKAFFEQDINQFRIKSREYLFQTIYKDPGILSSLPTVSASIVNNYNTELLNNFDIIPLNSNLNSLKGLEPFIYKKRETLEGDVDPVFDYNEKIRRMAYVTENQQLVYQTTLCNSGTVCLKAYFQKEKKEQVILDLLSYTRVLIYLSSTNEIKFEAFNTIYNTGIFVNDEEWNFILITWNKTIPSSSTSESSFTYKIVVNNNEYTKVIETTETYNNFKFSVGTMLSASLTPLSTMYGMIEMIALSNIYSSDNTINSLKTKLNVVTQSKEYDIFNRIIFNRLMKNENIIIKHKYYFETASFNTTDTLYGENIIFPDETSQINYFHLYDNNERIIATSRNSQPYRAYKYDYCGYLKEEELLDEEYKIIYTYDKNGNIDTKVKKDYNEVVLSEINYVYGNNNILGLLTRYNNTNIVYNDALPTNPTSFIKDGNYTYNLTWVGQKLVNISSPNSSSFSTITYIYNDSGLRRKKIKDSVETVYIYEDSKLVLEQTGTNKKYYLYDENGALYGIIYNDINYYYIRDALGTIIGLTDETGSIKVKYEYDAYGNILSVSGTLANTLGINNPFRYKGYYYDEETKLYYCNSRYYNPEWCRWISADSVDYLNPESINGLNLYAYCGNDPVNMVDPNGHFFFSALLIGALVGGLISTGISIGTQALTGDHTINWGQVALDGTIGAISGLLSATGIGTFVAASISGGLGFAGSVGGDLISSNGDWSKVNWGKATALGITGFVIGAWAGSGSQNSSALGKGLLKNKEVSSQFGRLYNAVNKYAAGTISKRGMTGVFNLYGGQFINAVSKALPGTVARLTAVNLGKLTFSTLVTGGIGLLF